MKKELKDLLTSYLLGWKTLSNCAEWLASINWDNLTLDQETMELVGRVELIVTEVMEGLRLESEFWGLANEIASKDASKDRTSIYRIEQNTFSTVNTITNSSNEISSSPLWLTVIERVAV
jgi:predicted DNA-binding ribbon-helix-helix protein